MAYTYRDAIKTAYKYLNIDETKVKKIPGTSDRGIVYKFNGEETVIFIYPISCKQNNKQNFFDTRDSGSKERAIAWEYAKENDLRYFCFGFNEDQERYANYILSLESDESAISNISFRKSEKSENTGTQVNIPADFIPKKNFERIKTPKGFYISAIQKEHVIEYLELFDNRPYMHLQADAEEVENLEERNKRFFRYWLERQVKPEGDSDAGKPYSSDSIAQYVSNISTTPLVTMPKKSVFYTTEIADVERTIEVLNNSEKKNNTQRSAVKKYLEYLMTIVSKEDCLDIFNHSLYGIHITKVNDALSTDNPHICIGWSALGDLSGIESKEELGNTYDKYFDKPHRVKNQDVSQVWCFYNDISIGDYVIFAESTVFHIGRVESDYYYDNSENINQDADYTNCRKVRWLKKNISRSVLSTNFRSSLQVAKSVWKLNDYKSVVTDLLQDTYQIDEDRADEEVANMQLVFNTNTESKFKRNRIIFGAPGTGKSFTLNREREELLGKDNEENFERVTFHPDYSYANFVGTYKPTMVNSGLARTDDVGKGNKEIAYEYVPGPFMRVLVKALKSAMSGEPKPYLLIVEEINRANVAAVFGDVFQLLDRDKIGVSEYSISTSNDIRTYLAEVLDVDESAVETIKIPDNMFIWATMNSADQGVFPMDTAFKRRWDFVYLGINDAVETYSSKIEEKKYILGQGEFARLVGWNDIRMAINDVLSSENFNINEDKLLGPYFISKNDLESDEETDFTDVFKNKVLMYLFDDAVKQKKKSFFEECAADGRGIRYSEICKAFDEKGVFIFPAEISSRFEEIPNE